MKNYMDQFNSPEMFIRHEVLANRGVKNVIDKSELLKMVVAQDSSTDVTTFTKGQLFDRLIELKGAEAYTLFDVGVGSNSFQEKFGISHKDVLLMAKKGFLKATGSVEFRLYGKNRTAKTYSPYQYYQLTVDEVHQWLELNRRKSNA